MDLSKLKTILLNGYVVTFSMFYSGQLHHYLSNNKIMYPSSKKNEYVLTSVLAYGDISKNSGHQMTIVGWDDEIEIDNDGDGIMDSRGALKVANSYGDLEGNGGFYWIAYDAIGFPDLIMDDIPHKASAIFGGLTYLLMPKKTYTPLLLAELTMETNCRRQLGLEFGISSTGSGEVSNYQHVYGDYDESKASLKNSNPFYFKGDADASQNYQPVNYDFYGNESAQRTEATFVFDLTDTIIDYYNGSGSDVIKFETNK